MGKFSNKEVPSFLKKANYYSEDETFDYEKGRNPEVSEECESCNQEPAISENKVLRFADFVNEKKKYNPKYDKDGDGDNDFEDYKAFKTDAINKSKKNESWDPRDAYEEGAYSNCCDAPVMMGDICSDCGEHCIPQYLGEEGEGEYPEEMGGAPSNYNEGHSCHDGSKNMLSEAAHHLIESICESTCSDASMYEADEDPEHKYEGYINEACAYMEKCMYEMVDDGMTINEGWNNESACYESTCEMIKEVCEKLCHEGLAIHNDESVNEFNEYVSEAIGCYKNGLQECAMGGYGMNESEQPDNSEEIMTKVTTWLASSNNQERALSLTPSQQAQEIGITIEDYEKAIDAIKNNL